MFLFYPLLKNVVNELRYSNIDKIPCPSPGCNQHFITTDSAMMDEIFSKHQIIAWRSSSQRANKYMVRNSYYKLSERQ